MRSGSARSGPVCPQSASRPRDLYLAIARRKQSTELVPFELVLGAIIVDAAQQPATRIVLELGDHARGRDANRVSAP